MENSEIFINQIESCEATINFTLKEVLSKDRIDLLCNPF